VNVGFVLVGISLMKGAEELCIRKSVKPEYGGGNKEFVFEDQHFFVGSDNPGTFFTSQERQSVVRHMLFSLRAHQGDTLDEIHFLEGQAVGMKVDFCTNANNNSFRFIFIFVQWHSSLLFSCMSYTFLKGSISINWMHTGKEVPFGVPNTLADTQYL